MSAARRQAFTLVEVLIVVVVLGILAGIVIVKSSEASGDAKMALAKDLHRTLQNGAAMYVSTMGRPPSNFWSFVSAYNGTNQSTVVLDDGFLSKTVDGPSVQHVFNDRIVLDFGTVQATYFIDANGTITASYATNP